ncbi:cupin domain-containing protein [Halorarius litoreus]|uniref:cupin domain-containing protein n=1 Tax=Halorarius litoreus TaxID=2962676 RepID=UPI0020CE39B9|nr:cupin domain-containing protein [Halorarius litoreus]
MRTVAIDAVPNYGDYCAAAKVLTSALDTEHLALNYFELAPGETPSRGPHAHFDQSETFVVLVGAVTFEVGDPRETEPESVVVTEGEAVRFEPGEYQQAWNRGDESATLLALGVPRDSEDVDLLRACPGCDALTTQQFEQEGDVLLTVCVDCGTETGRFE